MIYLFMVLEVQKWEKLPMDENSKITNPED